MKMIEVGSGVWIGTTLAEEGDGGGGDDVNKLLSYRVKD
jgi:hypothetical protein